MVFYILPPDGRTELSELETITSRRLEFLLAVDGCHGDQVAMKDLVEQTACVEISNGLIEGTKADQISHFMLRLACADELLMSELLTRAELALCTYRLSTMTSEELYSAVRPLRKLTHLLAKSRTTLSPWLHDIISVIGCLTRNCGWKTVIDRYISGSNETIKIPFQLVPKLVARRAVELQAGMALVPYRHLLDVLVSIFQISLNHGVRTAQGNAQSKVMEVRIQELISHLKDTFRSRRFNSRSAVPVLHHDEVDEAVSTFPPCMAQRHQQLRKKHRLAHTARIQYTLFLKEAGMPINEALHFWRKEYSVPGSHGNQCAHNWDKDCRRYTYNIRHLYGLEGSRINYRGHCCTAIQEEDLGATNGMGCPFKHMDRSGLQESLISNGLTNEQCDVILALVSAKRCQVACAAYLQAKRSQNLRIQVSTSTTSCVTENEQHESKCGEQCCSQRQHNRSHEHKFNSEVDASPRLKRIKVEFEDHEVFASTVSHNNRGFVKQDDWGSPAKIQMVQELDAQTKLNNTGIVKQISDTVRSDQVICNCCNGEKNNTDDRCLGVSKLCSSARLRCSKSDAKEAVQLKFEQISANELEDVAIKSEQIIADELEDVAIKSEQIIADELEDVAVKSKQISANELEDVAVKSEQISANELEDVAVKSEQIPANVTAIAANSLKDKSKDKNMKFSRHESHTTLQGLKLEYLHVNQTCDHISKDKLEHLRDMQNSEHSAVSKTGLMEKPQLAERLSLPHNCDRVIKKLDAVQSCGPNRDHRFPGALNSVSRPVLFYKPVDFYHRYREIFNK